jgi:hypothetical protein
VRSCVLVAVLLAILASVFSTDVSLAQLPAQVSASGAVLDANYASVTVDGYARSSVSDLSSTLWGASGRASGVGLANVARFGSGNVTGYGDLRGSLALSGSAQNISAFTVEAGAGAYRGRATSNFVESSLLLGEATRDGSRSAWLEASGGRAASTVARATAHARVGVSMRSALATVSAQLGVFASGGSKYADAALDAQWTPVRAPVGPAARFVAGLNAGMRSSNDIAGRHAWLMGMAAIRVFGPVSIVGYAGAQPPDPERGASGASFSSVALRVALGKSREARSPPAVSLSRATMIGAGSNDGTRLITIVNKDAKNMEIMGDFTAWAPVTMIRAGPGIWRVRLPLAEGSHRVEVRADSGTWAPAPGLPAAADDFGGTVGILVVQ